MTALDVLRALTRSPGSADALLAEVDLAAGADRRLDAAGARLRDDLKEATAATGDESQYRARRLAGQVAVMMQAALLVRHAPGAVADAFCASRLEPGVAGPGAPFGTLPDGLDLGPVLARSSTATDCR